jgi:ABC-type transport system involved in multi-copper enzyme maturation permease subunit
VLLLAIGLFGGSILGLPRVVTTTAGLIAVLIVFFFVPAAQLYVLLLERRLGAIRRQGYSVLAIQRRWYYSVVGGVAAVMGLVLVLSSTRTTVEIRFAGVILLLWGLLCIWVAVLAFRTKPWLADARRLR